MTIKLNIEPEDIQSCIAQAVLDSSIGEQLKLAIASALSSYGFQETLKKVVENEVQSLVLKLVREDYRDKIEKQVKLSLTDQVISYAVSNVVERIIR